jgi:hypothetical protein
MAEYRIICSVQVPAQLPNDRAHIVAVGTGSSASTYDKYWLLNEVLTAMDRGDKFFTFGEVSKRKADVEKYKCSFCLQTHIRSSPDAVKDNNLDSLPRCER